MNPEFLPTLSSLLQINIELKSCGQQAGPTGLTPACPDIFRQGPGYKNWFSPISFASYMNPEFLPTLSSLLQINIELKSCGQVKTEKENH
jgi:hypothetical protein